MAKLAPELRIRNARTPSGDSVAIAIRDGHIVAIGADVPAAERDLDARGLLVGAGLHDHHLHLLATAARMQSVDLSPCLSVDAVTRRLRARAAQLPPGQWIRATGYDERVAGLPDRARLDLWLSDRPLRVQDRTGGYWFLNSAAVAGLGGAPYPECVELLPDGVPSGRIFRGDQWLRQRIGGAPPSLAPLGRQLAAWGVTSVTDAGATNGPAEATLLGGQIPQRLTLMGDESLSAGAGYKLGPLKLLFDETDLPALEQVVARIRVARTAGRNIAAHCVTLAELLFYLAALAAAGGAKVGDRVEHGSVIAASLIGELAGAGLTVVTQQNFIHDRGDRYLAQIPPGDLPDLYRLDSLLRSGVRVLGGSDAPYGSLNPWVAIRAAVDRRSRDGGVVGKSESVSPLQAVALYQPKLAVGAPADLILYDQPADFGRLPAIALTLIGGNIVWRA